MQKKINFYALSAWKTESGSSDQHWVNNDELLGALQRIAKTQMVARQIGVMAHNRSVTIEFITGAKALKKGKKDNLIFGKLSQLRNKADFQLRDKSSLKSEELSVPTGKEFESKSYFLLDLDKMIVAYSRGDAAPSVMAFEALISDGTKAKKYSGQGFDRLFGKISQLTVADGLSFLKAKKAWGSVKYWIEIPKHVPRKIAGLSLKNQRLLKNQKRTVIEVRIQMEKRKGSMFSNADDMEDYVLGLAKDPTVEKISVGAKGEFDTRFSEILMENDPYALTVTFDFDKDEGTLKEYEDGLKVAMYYQYQTHQKDIDEYTDR